MSDSESPVGSGSGMDEVTQAQKLAESLALNTVPVKTIDNTGNIKRRFILSPDINTNEKRSKVAHPSKSKVTDQVPKSKVTDQAPSQKKSEKPEKSEKPDKSEKSKSEGPNDASAKSSVTQTKESDSKTPAAASTSPSLSSDNTITDDVSKAVEEKFKAKPSIGMSIKCKIPGKSEPLGGVLKYLGHISNLPKKSNVIVAGLELNQEENLGTDGSFLGKRYFTVPAKRGYFVPVKNCQPI